MDKTLQLQLQIRQNADEISSVLKDMKGWEKTITKKDKNLKIEKKKIAPRRTGGGTVPLRTFAPTAQTSSSTILTPASLVDATLSTAKTSVTTSSAVLVPKAIGTYEEKDAEEIERERGNNEFKGGNFSAAVKSYTKCLGLKKNNYVAFSNRAMAYLKLKEYYRAVLDCNCALSIEPTHVKSLLRRSTAYNSMGKHRAALRDLLSAQSIEPNNKQVKLDILQTKELLRSAVNRAPFVNVDPFHTFVEEFIHQDPSANKESLPSSDEKIEAEVIQGPDLPPLGLLSHTNRPIDEKEKNQTEIETNERSDIDFQRISIEDEDVSENDKKTPNVEVKETIKEESVESFNNMRIHLISEEEEDHNLPHNIIPEPTSKLEKKTSKASNTTLKKKKSTSSLSTSFTTPKSSYELEKILLQHHRNFPSKLRDFFTQIKRDKCIQLFKTCFEPSTLFLFLDALFADYKYQKEDASTSSSIAKARQVLSAYYRDVSELSNFEMLYGLLTNEEKQVILQQLQVLIKDVNDYGKEDEKEFWQNLFHRYQI